MEVKSVLTAMHTVQERLGIPDDEHVTAKKRESLSRIYLQEAEHLREEIERECAGVSDYISLRLTKLETLVTLRDEALARASALVEDGQ